MSVAASAGLCALVAIEGARRQQEEAERARRCPSSGGGPERILRFISEDGQYYATFNEFQSEDLESLRTGPNTIEVDGITFTFHDEILR